MEAVEVTLEIGKKRTFAGALDWPGWARSGRDEESALQALLDYGPRYARVLRTAKLGFQAPADVSGFQVVERLEGNPTTDFGAPDAVPARDLQPFGKADLQRFRAILEACWQALDEAVKAGTGKELRKGPRGGGRDLEGVIRHVLGSDAGYLSRLGRKIKNIEGESLELEGARIRQAILEALDSGARGELPERGPRGGKIWTPPQFVRRAAWHVLDHAWEIEDRVILE